MPPTAMGEATAAVSVVVGTVAEDMEGAAMVGAATVVDTDSTCSGPCGLGSGRESVRFFV